MAFGRPSPEDDQRAVAYRDWMAQRNPLAIGSVVLGIFSLLEFGAVPIFSLGAIVLGIIALARLRAVSSERPLGRRLAWTGLALGTISFAIFIYIRLLPTGH